MKVKLSVRLKLCTHTAHICSGSLQMFGFFFHSSRPKKTAVVNHGMPADSLGMFPYPSSDGTSSAVSTQVCLSLQFNSRFVFVLYSKCMMVLSGDAVA